MDKVLLVAFNGELMCFVHVLLNALDMKEKGASPRVIFEGASVKLVPELENAGCPFHGLYMKAKELDLIEGVCKGCAAKMGVLDAAEEADLQLLDNMKGHPSLGTYMEQGYTVVTF